MTGSDSVRKDKIIKHLQSLRAIGYSLIDFIQMGNMKLLYEILKNLYPAMLQNLRDDIILSVMVAVDDHGFVDERLQKIADLEETQQSEELSHTALDLLCHVITIKELYRYANSIGIDLSFIEKLYNCFKAHPDTLLKEQFAMGDPKGQKASLIMHQLLQAINDRKGIN